MLSSVAIRRHEVMLRVGPGRAGSGKRGRKGGDDLTLNRIPGDPDRAPDGMRIRPAMSDHRDAVDSKQQPAAQLPPIHAVAERLKLRPYQQTAERGDGI